MSLDRYRLISQIGAGPDGVSYRALAEDGATEVEVRDLSAAKCRADRWRWLVPRLRIAAQLDDPAAIRVLETGLEHDPPYAVLQFIGTLTLAASLGANRPKRRVEAMELIRDLAGALREAHRLGLPHGRLGPAQVLLAAETKPKLDFTGAAVGFPIETDPPAARDIAPGEPYLSNMAVARASDLYSLGALLAWLLTGRMVERHNRQHTEGEFDAGSSLGALIRELLADDPAERPSAREVQERLDSLLAPMDATGDWTKPGESFAQKSARARTNQHESIGSRSGTETLILDSGLPRLGRYHLLEKLGEGGQGIVYRAEDPSDGSIVAIKTLRTDRGDNSQVLRRFRKEARLMAEANNPQVVNLLEFNDEDGMPYMVLEFVAGESLGDLLAARVRLTEKEALSIMAGVARGLMQAHERGIVHRDIKPSNILFVEPCRPVGGSSTDSAEFALQFEPDQKGDAAIDRSAVSLASTVVKPTSALMSATQVKISDFGLARHVVDTESLALTAAGAILGTPHYMAPEQWTGRAIDARTDVYAMGATLFHLLAGRPPFLAETRDALCAQHCNDAPPSLAAINPAVSDGVGRVVERALAKRPEDRYADAGVMLGDIEALLHDKPSDLAIHPRLPDCDKERILQFEFRWELQSAPRQLWPLVTNTDRLDRAIGFAPVTYKNRYEPGRGLRTFIEGRKAGTIEIGEEHPYEWVEPRRMSVLREYSQGPFRWLISVVELTPRPGGGTTLIHRLRLEPSSWKIRVGSRWGVGVGLRKSLERVYQRIDATIQIRRQRGVSPAIDPFEEPARIPVQGRQRLERILDRLIEQGVDAAVVDQLGEYLALGPPLEVARIRPLALAERWVLDPDQVVAACLRGAHEGLLELHWDLLCPVCRISCQVTDTLRAIAEHAHCEACHLDFQLDFANSIELIFRVHPEIRQADLGTYCVGGPAHSPHVLAQVRIAPGERFELDLELPAGSYRLRGPQLPWSIDFNAQGSATIRRWDIDLGAAIVPEAPRALRAGGQILILNNPCPLEIVVRVERTATRGDALTAARATSMALFRELFADEVLAPGKLATVSMVTLMVTALDPDQADALYRDLGDARAFGVVHEHLQRLGEAIRAGGGAVVKTMGEGLLASFDDVRAAVLTGLDLVPRLTTSATTHMLHPRIGIHRGTTLAATLNDQLDYFGTTARQAARTLEYAHTGELVVTQAVAADPAVAALLSEHHIEGEVIRPEVPGQQHVIRLRAAELASAEPSVRD
jgi:serine/threonine protein kinase/class 3 adenylate cyclase